jgi:uncharacterized protein (DUF433 family)
MAELAALSKAEEAEVLESLAQQIGWTEAKILSSYPTLRAVDLVHAWAYVDSHRQEIDEEIGQNEAA